MASFVKLERHVRALLPGANVPALPAAGGKRHRGGGLVAPGGRRSRRVLTWPHLLIRELVLLLCLVSLPYLDPAPRGVGVWFARERRLANMVFAVTANWAWVWPWSG